MRVMVVLMPPPWVALAGTMLLLVGVIIPITSSVTATVVGFSAVGLRVASVICVSLVVTSLLVVVVLVSLLAIISLAVTRLR